MSYFDAGAIVIMFIVFIIAHFYLLVHPLKFLEKVFTEFKHLADGRLGWTGAVNALGVIVVALIGALIFVEGVLGHLLALAVKLLQPQHAQEYVESVTAFTLFVTIAMLTALSTLLTLFAERTRRP